MKSHITRPGTAAGLPLVVIVAVVSLLLAGFAATQSVRATTDHCDDHAAAALKIEADGNATGSFDHDGTTVWFEVDGDTVVFTDSAGNPVVVEFCVKAGTGTSGVVTGSEYTVDFETDGGQIPAISYVAIFGATDEEGAVPDADGTVDADALVLTALCTTADGTSLFRLENTGDVNVADGRLTATVEGTAEAHAIGALDAGAKVDIETTATGSITLLLHLDSELIATVSSNVALCSDDDDGDDDGAADASDLTVVTTDAAGTVLADVELSLTATGTTDTTAKVTDDHGVAVFADLAADSTFALAVTDVPDEDCAVAGELAVTVAADGTLDVTDAAVGAGIEIATWTASDGTLVIALPCEMEDAADADADAGGDVAGQGQADADATASGEGTLAGTGGTAGGTTELPDTAVGTPVAPIAGLATLLLTLLPLGGIVGHSLVRRARRR